MTDDVLDDPILDDRIRRALTALADSHTPTATGPGIREPKGRRLLAAAATVFVLGGIGALVLAGQREGADRPVTTRVPAPVDSAAPDSTIPRPTEPGPTDHASATAPATGDFRFDAPLPVDTVAVLDPPPFPFVEAFRVEQADVEFLTGRGSSVQIMVLDADGSPGATVSVTDLDIPLDTIESSNLLQVGGGTTLSYAGVGAETFFAVAGSSIRELSVPNLRSTDNEFSQFDERLQIAADVAAHVEGQLLNDLEHTDRFVPTPVLNGEPTVISYTETGVQGEGGLLEVVLLTTERAIDTDEFEMVASAFGEVLDLPTPNAAVVEMAESPQLQYVEQISPTQFVVISADPDTDRAALDTFIASLTFVDAATVGIEVELLGGGVAPVITRGDETWGRWELYEPTAGGECPGFGATVWGDGSRNTRQASPARCSQDDEVSPQFVCLSTSTGELPGLSLGDGVIDFSHPSIGSAIVGEPGEPIDGLGLPTPFLIEPASAASDPLIVLVDGEPVELPCR